MSWLMIGEPERLNGKTKVLCMCSQCGLQKYLPFYKKNNRVASATHRGCGTDYNNKLIRESAYQPKAYKLLGGKPL